MSKRKLKVLRVVAMFMLITLLNQMFFPSVCLALTSGNTQPEVYGYQAVDATDNVSLTSGNFNYTIPITSIPEFPMAIGYNAGMGMDQEASAFGFGFNGFSGAITRSVNGLPDDLKGGFKQLSFGNEPMKDINTTIGMTLGLGRKIGNIQASAHSSTTYGFNNYSGGYGAISLGLAAQYSKSKLTKNEKEGATGCIGIGVDFVNDSRESAPRFGASAGLGIGGSIGGAGKSETVAGVYATKQLKKGSEWKTGGSVLGQQFGNSNFPGAKSTVSSSMAPLAYIYPKRGGSSLSMGFNINFVSFATQWSVYKFADADINKNGYGFMYLNSYDRANDANIADMTIEGEDSFNENSFNNPSYLQKDNYSINTMGISGGMELYQKTYGVVSRNSMYQQTNERKTNRSKSLIDQVHPWVGVNQLSQNKSLDIMAMLKDLKNAVKDKGSDITNSAYNFFSEDEKVNLNSPNQRFKSEAEFKMRGDYAGEYDLASTSFTDHEISPFSLIHVSGTSSDPKFAFLGVEKNVPLYYPQATRDYYNYSANHKIEKSTHITKHTIGSILTAYSALKNVNPSNAHTSSAATDPFYFNQSFYSHYEYAAPAVSKSTNVILNDHLNKMNILKSLNSLRNSTLPSGPQPSNRPTYTYFDDLIGSMEVESVNGLRYFFNLPVFNKTSKSVELLGKGKNAPELHDGDYHSFVRDGKGVDHNRMETKENYMYPYAWMLTAIVGDDYIDFDNIPGPSDGDIGYWVKFKYIKAASNYRWRTPFTGMDYFPGLMQKADDDAYSATSGTKEIYYLSEIESSNYKCKYQYQKRFDAIDAAGFYNGAAHNSLRDADPNSSSSTDLTGSNFQFAVTQIDLYKKHTNGSNSANIDATSEKIIKSTKFYYDYTTCKGVPNNYAKYYTQGIPKNTVPYHMADGESGSYSDIGSYIKTGKLTLRKVQHIAYDESGDPETATFLPSYSFNYFGDADATADAKYNPAYDRNAVDQWGNYMAGSKHADNGINYYEHYTEYLKSEADINAKAFKLKTIRLPSGGSMEVDYEAQSYGYVEDKTPYVMRHVISVDDGTTLNTAVTNDDGYSFVTVDVTDIGLAGLNGVTTTNAKGEEKKVLNIGDKVYGEIAYYRSTSVTSSDPDYRKPYNTVIIPEEATVEELLTPYQDGTKWYQRIKLRSLNNDDYKGKPFISQCEVFMYGESDEARAIGDEVNTNNGCANVQSFTDNYEDLYRNQPTDAIRKIIAHGDHMLNTHNQVFENRFNTCFGQPALQGNIYEHWSFLRTPIYKAKYTGAVVKSIKLYDGFNYTTQPNGTLSTNAADQKQNEYGTNYYYDMNGDSTGTSSGVATNEPGGGKSCIQDMNATIGAGFMSSPNIIYSKASLENLYHGNGVDEFDKISRKKGKTSYEFYSPKDHGFQFANNFKQQSDYSHSDPIKGNFFLFGIFTFLMIKFKIGGLTVTIKRPRIVRLILNWKQVNKYHLKSYSYTDYTDIFGKLKAIHQIDASGQELGTQKYNYYGLDEPVPVYQNGFTSLSTSSQKPGKMDQVWSEAYYTQKDKIQFIIPFFLMAKTEKDFCYTNMKYSYVPPVLKEQVSTIDGLTTTTTYSGFDYYTGSPVEAKSTDSYENTKISRTVPAYWKYPEMGPRSVDDNNLNNLTATTGTYMYLGSVADGNLIGAGVVKWAKGNDPLNSWDITSYLQPTRNYVDATTYNYNYSVIKGSSIESAYSKSARSGDKTGSGIPRLQRNASIYKAYKGYTYEVPITSTGTFTSFTQFSYVSNASNSKWKQLSTNELYSPNGVLLQSKDVLSKYASQLLGYNFSNTTSAISNSSWGACAYEGAENTYNNSDPAIGLMLEDFKVKKLQASVIKKCDRSFTAKTLTTASFPTALGTIVADVLTVTLPSTINYNVPFAKLQITYSNGLSRSLYVSVNDNNDFQVMSNQGEVFNGFFVYPQLNGSYKLLFNPNDFSAGGFSLNTNFTTLGYVVSCAVGSNIQACDMVSKPYEIPRDDCGGKVHTGSYAFALEPGSKGTDFLISANAGTSPEATVTQAEFKRKFKALVWVHNSSSEKTELVMQVTDAAGTTQLQPEIKTSKATPYVVAGDWSLLRLDFDLSNLSMANPYVHVFVRNSSTTAVATYDDYRVLPFNADMTNWVFDHHFNRVVSGLDVDNFASYSNYDSRGRVIESSVELQNEGIKTVQKFLYNDQKTN